MKERSKVQALDPTCGVWLSGQIISVEDDYFNLKWIGYDQTARLPKKSVREPILKRLWKFSKGHWPNSDPRSLQRGDKVVHLQPNGDEGLQLQVEENDPWNGKIKVAGRFYLYEHLCEVKDTSEKLDDDGLLAMWQGENSTRQLPLQEKRVSKTGKVQRQPLKERAIQNAEAKNNKQVQRQPLKEKAIQNAEAKHNKQKRRSKEPEEKEVAKKKKKSVTKEAARPLAVGQPWEGNKSTPLNQQEKEQVESTPQKDIENCPPDVLIKYGMAALEQLSNAEDGNVEEMPPPLSPLSPEVTPDMDRLDLRTVVELLQLSFEDEQRKRKALEEKVRVMELHLERLIHEKAQHGTQTPRVQAPEEHPHLIPQQLQEQTPMQPHLTPQPPQTPQLPQALQPPQTPQPPQTLQPPQTPQPSQPLQPPQTLQPLQTLQPPQVPQPPPTLQPLQPPQPPQTPLMPSHSTLTNEENVRHSEKLRSIFDNVISTPEYALNGAITSYTLQPEVLIDLSWFAQSPKSMARELMRRLFTSYELSSSNVRGIRKAALDPRRIETIRKTVFQLCTVPPYLRTTVWKDCVKSMDQANRNAKKLNYSTLS